jgi:hypothetical protein
LLRFLEAFWDTQACKSDNGTPKHAMFQVKNCCCGLECSASCCRWGPTDFQLVKGEPPWNPKDVCDAIFWAFGETDEDPDIIEYKQAAAAEEANSEGVRGNGCDSSTNRDSGNNALKDIKEMLKAMGNQMQEMQTAIASLQKNSGTAGTGTGTGTPDETVLFRS